MRCSLLLLCLLSSLLLLAVPALYPIKKLLESCPKSELGTAALFEKH